MTLAAMLAHLVCEETVPVPGVVHDPAQPLILGNQAGQDYVVITWDAINHRVQIQSVYKPPGAAPLQQSTLTFNSQGVLLINGGSIANLPEFQQAVQAAQAAATAAQASQVAAAQSEGNAQTSASQAATSANTATTQADLATGFAQAAEGTPLPGGGDSAAVSAQKAADVAVATRLLQLGGDVNASEVFQSGFLNTERQVIAASPIQITIPPGIHSSNENKAAWAAYKMRGAGTVQFIPQAGGSNLVTPSIKATGRAQRRIASTGTGTFHLLDIPITVPAGGLVNGELLLVFNAQHQGQGNPSSIEFTNAGGLTFQEVKPFPANPSAVAIPDYWCVRAALGAVAAGTVFNLQTREGVFAHFQAAEWWLLDDVEGSLPQFAVQTRSLAVNRSDAIATLTALPQFSRVLWTAGSGAPSSDQGFANVSNNVAVTNSGVTDNVTPDSGVSNADDKKNQVWARGNGVANATGNFTVTANFTSAAYKCNILVVGYQPKSQVGAGSVTLNLEGGRDTLSVANGVAELWFRPDGQSVDIRTPKP